MLVLYCKWLRVEWMWLVPKSSSLKTPGKLILFTQRQETLEFGKYVYIPAQFVIFLTSECGPHSWYIEFLWDSYIATEYSVNAKTFSTHNFDFVIYLNHWKNTVSPTQSPTFHSKALKFLPGTLKVKSLISAIGSLI